jgi:hypothetical protein
MRIALRQPPPLQEPTLLIELGKANGGTDMPEKINGRIVETATEARQAERGPSVAVVLATSLGLAFVAMAVIWFIFFRT